jgi:pilus assembly protein CpaC
MTRSRSLIFALALALGALGGGVPARTALAQQVIPTTGEPIQLQVNRGVLIKLDRDADTIFVADPTVADVKVKSPRLVYLFAKAVGETSLYAVDAHQVVVMGRAVLVSRDVARLQVALHQLLPHAEVSVQAVDSTLVLAGQVSSALEAEEAKRLVRPFVTDDKQLVNRIEVTTPNQVNLQVRVAEVSHDVIKELGINWDAVAYNGSKAFGLATGSGAVLGSAFSPSITGGTPTGNFNTLPTSGLAGATQNSFFFGTNNSSRSLDATVNALNQDGLIKILADPNLTALSGETASFLAGGEFPILLPGTLGSAPSVDFKPFGVALAFTPVVLDSGRISMRVRPEVSQLTTTGEVEISGNIIPALSTRRAETTVELGSGQTFAIGGLLQNNITDTVSKVPGLGDVPVLGPLFRSTAFQRNESELVILVTPYLVRPVSGKQMANPADGMTPGNEVEHILQGRMAEPAAVPGGPQPVGPDGDRLVGSAGFVLN